jgi:hypothetical protein
MVNLEGSGNPPKYFSCHSLYFCLSCVSGEKKVRFLFFGGDENANAPDYSVPFFGNLRSVKV